MSLPRPDAHVGTDSHPPVITPLPDRDAEPDPGQACPDAALACVSPAEIRSRALKLLTTREHSRYELWRKLHLRGYAAEAVNAVLDALAADGLLSEERLIAAYVAERLDKGFGPLRIRSELQAKGLSGAAIDPHLELDDAQVLARMTAVDAGKFARAAADDGQTLAKRARFLEYRGFPAHLIARVLALD